MKLVTRLSRAAAVGALLLAGSAPAPADEIDDLAHQLAGNAAALRLVLDRLSSPATARMVIDSAVRRDARAFNQIFEGIELNVPNKCFWISDLIETASSHRSLVEECTLRTDLTVEEWNLYLGIASRHDQLGARGSLAVSYLETDAAGRTLVKPSAFLDELKANGLVTCENVPKYYGSSVAFGKPQWFCFQQP